MAPVGRVGAGDSAWTAAIAVSKTGHPHIGYSAHLSNEGHRYRIASWDGTPWHDTRVILWNRSDFKTFVNYQFDTVGLVETVKSANAFAAKNPVIVVGI